MCPETPNLTELVESVDDTLFQRIIHNLYHVLHHLLPERREVVYSIRPRHHDRQLSIISGQPHNRKFIYSMLFKDSSYGESVALLVARRTKNRKVAGSRPIKVVCISVDR